MRESRWGMAGSGSSRQATGGPASGFTCATPRPPTGTRCLLPPVCGRPPTARRSLVARPGVVQRSSTREPQGQPAQATSASGSTKPSAFGPARTTVTPARKPPPNTDANTQTASTGVAWSWSSDVPAAASRTRSSPTTSWPSWTASRSSWCPPAAARCVALPRWVEADSVVLFSAATASPRCRPRRRLRLPRSPPRQTRRTQHRQPALDDREPAPEAWRGADGPRYCIFNKPDVGLPDAQECDTAAEAALCLSG